MPSIPAQWRAGLGHAAEPEDLFPPGNLAGTGEILAPFNLEEPQIHLGWWEVGARQGESVESVDQQDPAVVVDEAPKSVGVANPRRVRLP